MPRSLQLSPLFGTDPHSPNHEGVEGEAHQKMLKMGNPCQTGKFLLTMELKLSRTVAGQVPSVQGFQVRRPLCSSCCN